MICHSFFTRRHCKTGQLREASEKRAAHREIQRRSIADTFEQLIQAVMEYRLARDNARHYIQIAVRQLLVGMAECQVNIRLLRQNERRILYFPRVLRVSLDDADRLGRVRGKEAYSNLQGSR